MIIHAKKLALLYARLTLGIGFLSGIADRFGWWRGRNVGYGNFDGFLSYTAKVNSFMPAFSIPFLAWAATVAELVLGCLIAVRIVAALDRSCQRAIAGTVRNRHGHFLWRQVAS